MIEKIFSSLFNGSSRRQSSPPVDAEAPEVWLHPDSEVTRSQGVAESRKIEKQVFSIGRRASSAVNYPQQDAPDLLIYERAPYTLSRLQCQIEIDGGQVILKDMGSRSGTKLGGKRLISKKREPKSMLVPKGEHTLVLGPRESPYRFKLVVS